MKTHRKLALAIATTLGIGLMASGGAFGHGWGHGYGYGGYGYGYGGQGYQTRAAWMRPGQPAVYRYRRCLRATALGPRVEEPDPRGEKTGAPRYGRRLHARAGVCPWIEGQTLRPRYGAWLGPRQVTPNRGGTYGSGSRWPISNRAVY